MNINIIKYQTPSFANNILVITINTFEKTNESKPILILIAFLYLNP